MSQPLLPQPHSNSLLPPPPGLVPPGNAGRMMPGGNLGGMVPPGNPGLMPPGNPGALMPPGGGLVPPSSSSNVPPSPPGGGLMPPVSGPSTDGPPHLSREGSIPGGANPVTDSSVPTTPPPFVAPPQFGLLPQSAGQATISPPVSLPQPGPVQGGPGPRMAPPPHMRFPPPGQLPPNPGGVGPAAGPRPLMGLLPPGQQGHPPPGTPPEVWFEHKTADGHTYYSHSQSRQTTWERPLNAQIVPQPGPGQPMGPVPGFPPSVPFSSPGAPGGAAPQLVPTRVWSEHQTPDGKVYFYNKVTRQSVWEKPRDFELIMPLPINFSHPPPSAATAAGGVPGPLPVSQSGDGSQQSTMSDTDASSVGMETIESEQEQHSDHEMVESSQQLQEESESSMSANNPSTTNTTSPMQEQSSEPSSFTTHQVSSSPLLKAPVSVSYVTATVPPIKPEDQQLPQVPIVMKKERSGPHPIKSVPVPGTPWSVVWSSDERIFFFNATTRVSLWSMPDDLKYNPQVEKILDEPVAGKKRVGAIEPMSDAKRFKVDDEIDSDMEENIDMEQKQVDLQENQDGIEPIATKAQSDAADIEKKAAAVRAGKSLEDRQKEFHEMLLERGVSAFSTWEKELPKFVFDPRYLLLNTKERKACFETFIRLRAEEERKERKTKLKEKRDVFRNLLEEAKLHAKSSFSDFASKYSKDSRFKAIEKMREREQMFTDYLTELKKASRHKEDHHRHLSSKSKAEKVKSDFLTMLGESDAITERSQWRKMKTLFDRDPRYKAVESSSQREEWFKEYVKELTSRVDPEQERQERIQASLKEREREVKMSRTAHEKEWGRERDQLRKAEATQHFKALLVDMVRNSEAVWHDTKQSLKKDHRWGLADQLEPSEKEKLFQDHVEGLFEKKRLQFRRLLEDTTQISLTMPWKKARKLIKEDPRYKNFGQHDHRREMEYDRYLRDKMVEAKNEFRALLKETKIITYKSHELIRESEKHHKDIVDILKNDQRYLVLDCVADDRKRMFEDYVYELHQRGPPPPPTATNPSERLKRPPMN